MGLHPKNEQRIQQLEDALFYSLEANVETLLLIKTGQLSEVPEVAAWLRKYRTHFTAWQRILGQPAVKRLMAQRARAMGDRSGGDDAK